MSGPRAFEGFESFIAVSTWLVVMKMGVVARLWSFLIVRRLVLSGAKFVGFVKCLLKELAMDLLVVWVVLLKVMERLGSVEVGSLLLSDLMVFQYMF